MTFAGNHWKVADTAASATQRLPRFMGQAFMEWRQSGRKGRAGGRGCHGEQPDPGSEESASPVNAANVSAETCGRCHASARIAKLYDLPADRVPSYADSYHGLALKGGKLTAANCASVPRRAQHLSPVTALDGEQRHLGKTCGPVPQGGGGGALLPLARARADQRRPQSSVVKWIR